MTPRADLTLGVRSLHHAALAAAEVRGNGGQAVVDVGRCGWPATVVLPGTMSLSSRRRARSLVAAVDPGSERLRRRWPRRASVRVETIRRASRTRSAP